MDKFRQLWDCDTMQVLFASGTGIGSQLTNWNEWLKIGIGLLTIVYLSMKIWKAKKDL